jgi:hypothetical protein
MEEIDAMNRIDCRPSPPEAKRRSRAAGQAIPHFRAAVALKRLGKNIEPTHNPF